MFFYLSFLRPPPTHVSLSGSISVTPQVANDLRTELFTGAQEIFYAWSRAQPTRNAGPNALPAITEPRKLTIWRQSNAYKEIPVPLPHGVREGQCWRLHLTAHPRGNPHAVNLAGSSLGERPFPVMSMPIQFSSRKIGGTAASKQEQVERIYRIPLGAQEQAFLFVKEQTSFDLDKKVWDSGVGLSSWIVDLTDQQQGSEKPPRVNKLKEVLLSPHPCHVLELGAGTGIVSLTLGVLRSAAQAPQKGSIVTTDLPSAMPLLEHNISMNESLFVHSSVRPHAVVLDWDEELPSEVSNSNVGFDAIIMADVTYNTASFSALVRTLSKLLGLPRTSTSPPLILLGYKERDPAERTLWVMAREIGIAFEKVGERRGAGGETVEIWIGQAV
ncbi:putative methyltransferase-domain-containing protein [Amylocystis lapponica]|nr:putative methyltransferase-domain-containing protein [Amylocystis lapponica]